MKLARRMLPLVAVFLLTRSVIAGGHGNGGNCDCCPDCGDKVCHPTWVEKSVKKHCYEVECKDICIPGLTLPWSKDCKPKCGRVITVKVFKKKEYECKTCGCKWEIKGGCAKGKGNGKAKAKANGATPAPTLAPPPPPASAKKPSLGRPKFGQTNPRGPLPVLSGSTNKQLVVRLPKTNASKSRRRGGLSTFKRLFFPERTVSYNERTKK